MFGLVKRWSEVSLYRKTESCERRGCYEFESRMSRAKNWSPWSLNQFPAKILVELWIHFYCTYKRKEICLQLVVSLQWALKLSFSNFTSCYLFHVSIVYLDFMHSFMDMLATFVYRLLVIIVATSRRHICSQQARQLKVDQQWNVFEKMFRIFIFFDKLSKQSLAKIFT